MFTVSIPGIILWLFGVPFYLLFSLNQWQKDLVEAKKSSDPLVYKKLYARYRLRMGFIINGYTDEYYYWEVVILMRKNLLVLLIVFFAPLSAGVSAGCSMILLIFFAYASIMKSPFYFEIFNKLDIVSMVSLLLIIYIGMFFLTSPEIVIDQASSRHIILLICLIFSSWCFILYFILKIRYQMLGDSARMDSNWLFFLCSCGLIRDKKQFMKSQYKMRGVEDSDHESQDYIDNHVQKVQDESIITSRGN